MAPRLLSTSVKRAAAWADVVRTPRPGVVVLLYHRIGGGTSSEVDLPPALFAEQLAELAAAYRVVTLDEALLASRTAPADGENVIAVTFDDGTADFATIAVPLLEQYRIPATVYVATDFVERDIAFPDGSPPLSWAALGDALATGLVEVGSHTHTHALLDRLPAPRVAEELDRSIALVGDRLGVAARHFAYPKAVPGSVAADRAVRERFSSAALAGTRANRYGRTDAFRLARSPIQVSDGMTWFRKKAAGGMALEDRLRRTLNRWRYAGTVT